MGVLHQRQVPVAAMTEDALSLIQLDRGMCWHSHPSRSKSFHLYQYQSFVRFLHNLLHQYNLLYKLSYLVPIVLNQDLIRRSLVQPDVTTSIFISSLS